MAADYEVMRNPAAADANTRESWWVVERAFGGPHEGDYYRWLATTSSARRARWLVECLATGGGA